MPTAGKVNVDTLGGVAADVASSGGGGGAPTGAAGGALGGTYPNPTVNGLVNATIGGGYLTLGDAPAATGSIRLSYATAMRSRNANGLADVDMIQTSGALGPNTVQVGNDQSGLVLIVNGGYAVVIAHGVGIKNQLGLYTAIDPGGYPLVFGWASGDPMGLDAVPSEVLFRGRDANPSATTNVNGGNLDLQPGAPVGAGVYGFVLARNVATFADNTAATAGGVPVDAIYRTSAGALMIRY
jgi:hypothetical protein